MQGPGPDSSHDEQEYWEAAMQGFQGPQGGGSSTPSSAGGMQTPEFPADAADPRQTNNAKVRHASHACMRPYG